jgi:hypothetical protein
MKKLILSIVAGSAAWLTAQADTIRQWDFNSITSDFLSQTGTRRPNDGIGAIAQSIGGVGNRIGTVSTVNQPDDPNTLDNSHWRIGQTEGVETGFPAATSANKTAGALFPVNTSGYNNIRVTWSQENSATASRYWRVQYTSNGVDWIDTPTVITAISTDANGTESGTPIWQHNLTADFTGLDGVDNNPNFAFRLVSEFESTATGAGADAYVANRAGVNYGRGGTLWLDMVTVTGDSIDPVNQWPVVSAIADQLVLTNESSAAVEFTISDAETDAANLTVSAVSLTTNIVNTIALGGTDATRTVTVTPEPGQQGVAVIVVRAQDAGGKVRESSFEVTVTVPSILPIANQTTSADAPLTVAIITTNLPGEPELDWAITGGSSNPSVVADSGILFGPSATSNYVTITPVAGSMGSTIITITNTGARGWQVTQSFEVTVLPPKIVFFDLSGLPSSGGVPSATATVVSNGLSAGELTRGPGIVQAGLGNGFSANNWNNTNSTVNPVVANRDTAISDGEYFEFSVTVTDGFKLSLSSFETSLRRSAVASPMNYELQYSFDDFATPGIVITNFNYFGRDSGTAPATLAPFQWMTTDTPGQGSGNPTLPFRLDGVAALQNLPAGTKITLRLYAWGMGNGADSNTVALGRVNGPALRGIVEESAAQAPGLAIRRVGPDVMVSWPTNATGFELQSSASLTPPQWQAAGLVSSIDDTNNVVTISNPSGALFLRLVK